MTPNLNKSIYFYNKQIARAFRHKGAFLFMVKNYSEAVKCYNKEIEHFNPNDDPIESLAYAYYNKANCLIKINELTNGIACYNKAIELKPGFCEGILTSLLFNLTLEFQYYISFFEKKALLNKGSSYYKQKDYQTAIECYNIAIEYNKNDPDTYYVRIPN